MISLRRTARGLSIGVVALGVACASIAACSDDTVPLPGDAGVDARPPFDAGADDAAAALDGMASDAAPSDASSDTDATASDGGTPDAALDARVDASGVDAAPGDGGLTDAFTDDAGPLLTDIVVTHPAQPPIAPATECTVTTATQSSCGGAHVPSCSPLDFATTPPACGPHFGSWAAFSVYSAPVPWGFLLHAMEHGAVVLAYACDATTCPTVPTALRDFVDTYTADPRCSSSSARARLIVVPDPTLDVPIALVAWGHIYRATCFDLASIREFVDAHYAGAPEDFCADGIDRSATGWCSVDAGL